MKKVRKKYSIRGLVFKRAQEKINEIVPTRFPN